MIRDNIGHILLKAGRITEEQLDAALREQKRSSSSMHIGEILVKLGFASHEDIARSLSEQLKIPYVELGDDLSLEQNEVKLIPEAIARRFHIIPLKKENNTITVGMKDPLDVEAVDMIRSLTNLEVNRVISTDDKILASINKYYKEEEYIESNLKDIANVENGKAGNSLANNVDADQLRILANDVPVVRLVNLLLLQAIRDRASDIHFEPGEHDVTVRLRVDGYLREVTPPPKICIKPSSQE